MRTTKRTFKLFEASADLGYMTSLRSNPKFASSGFFPVTTQPLNRDLEKGGGDLFLKSMNIEEALVYVEELRSKETADIGLEPFLTECVVEKGLVAASSKSAQKIQKGKRGGKGPKFRGSK